MTEAEAKTKWCPYARVMFAATNGTAVHGLPAGNRSQVDGENDALTPFASNCIASACMAWRPWRRSAGVPGGYCGLAGRPE